MMLARMHACMQRCAVALAEQRVAACPPPGPRRSVTSASLIWGKARSVHAPRTHKYAVHLALARTHARTSPPSPPPPATTHLLLFPCRQRMRVVDDPGVGVHLEPVQAGRWRPGWVPADNGEGSRQGSGGPNLERPQRRCSLTRQGSAHRPLSNSHCSAPQSQALPTKGAWGGGAPALAHLKP